jgi:large subunit ribosomal protein L11
MAQKKIIANIKMRIPAGKASAGPPVGSTLGQYGVNMMDFVNPFNDQTKDMMGADVTAHVEIYEDKSMSFRVVGESAKNMIKKAAGAKKGSGRPHEEKVATITDAQLTEVAEAKMKDLNTDDIDQAKRVIAGTARSMGVEVK